MASNQNESIAKNAVQQSLAGIAQLVERNLAKVEVASSNLVSRSSFQPLADIKQAITLFVYFHQVAVAVLCFLNSPLTVLFLRPLELLLIHFHLTDTRQ